MQNTTDGTVAVATTTKTASAQPENVRKPIRVIETPVYALDDLDDDAKEIARNWCREFVVDHDWWDSTFEDAETIGLKITSFELDRGRHANGDFTKDADEVIALIVANHGKDCETFKTAMLYKEALKIARKRKHESDSVSDVEEEFRKSLLEDYSIMLQHEYEYLLSDESVDETIRANEYTFTETGKREG